MRDRIQSREVWERLGLDADACIAHAEHSGIAAQFRHRLFSKIVPNVKSLGLPLGAAARALPSPRHPPVRERDLL
jgi:hypothetical protein